jgi:hypothetical protein
VRRRRQVEVGKVFERERDRLVGRLSGRNNADWGGE